MSGTHVLDTRLDDLYASTDEKRGEGTQESTFFSYSYLIVMLKSDVSRDEFVVQNRNDDAVPGSFTGFPTLPAVYTSVPHCPASITALENA